MKLIEYAATRKPTYDIDLDQPPRDRWKHVAQKEAHNIARLLQDVVDLSVEQAEHLPAYLRPLIVAAGKGTARLAGRIVHWIASLFGQDYVAEIRSISKHAEVPLSYLVLGNLIYDLTQMGGLVGVGCSSFSCNIDGQPTLARNMDWVVPESTGRHSRLVRFHKGDEHYLSVSVLGCVGVVSAMCPGKWAVTINQAPTDGTRPGHFQWPVLQRLRAVCDGMGSYREVVDGVQEYRTMTPFFAHVIGTESNQHKVITGLGKEFKRRGMKSGCLVQTNHHVGNRELACLNPTKGTWFEDDVEWYFDTYPRLESLKCRLEEPPSTLAEVHQRLRGRPVTFENTMQQMIFQPASGYAKVLVRE